MLSYCCCCCCRCCCCLIGKQLFQASPSNQKILECLVGRLGDFAPWNSRGGHSETVVLEVKTAVRVTCISTTECRALSHSYDLFFLYIYKMHHFCVSVFFHVFTIVMCFFFTILVYTVFHNYASYHPNLLIFLYDL